MSYEDFLFEVGELVTLCAPSRPLVERICRRAEMFGLLAWSSAAHETFTVRGRECMYGGVENVYRLSYEDGEPVPYVWEESWLEGTAAQQNHPMMHTVVVCKDITSIEGTKLWRPAYAYLPGKLFYVIGVDNAWPDLLVYDIFDIYRTRVRVPADFLEPASLTLDLALEEPPAKRRPLLSWSRMESVMHSLSAYELGQLVEMTGGAYRTTGGCLFYVERIGYDDGFVYDLRTPNRRLFYPRVPERMLQPSERPARYRRRLTIRVENQQKTPP